ncbi:hypothetical protein B0H10DRAFT_2088402 [Mycena sp. CBHHK59/15]|nr:hypothetical protein B0H10DRAFT_2088402 [Mycena sp. CBHHK59/15]
MSSSNPSPEPLSVRIAASKVQNQMQSPLFSLLHPELRNMVFRHALTEYDDPARPYSKHAYHYRPGFEFAGRIDTDLLLTCRLVYLETHLAPISLNEHVFWQYRGPPDGSFSSDHTAYFHRMTPQQRAAVRRVRFFTQLYWLENRGPETWFAGLSINKLTITIRHTDWWWWEDGADLRIQEPAGAWDGWVGSVPGLEEVELELESIEPKRAQLDEWASVARSWQFPLAAGGCFVHDGEEPVTSMWIGSSRMSGNRFHGFDSGEEQDGTDSEWNDGEGDFGAGSEAEGGSEAEENNDPRADDSDREDAHDAVEEQASHVHAHEAVAVADRIAQEQDQPVEAHVPAAAVEEQGSQSHTPDIVVERGGSEEHPHDGAGVEDAQAYQGYLPPDRTIFGGSDTDDSSTDPDGGGVVIWEGQQNGEEGSGELPEGEREDLEVTRDRQFPIDLVLHVRKLRFVHDRLANDLSPSRESA